MRFTRHTWHDRLRDVWLFEGCTDRELDVVGRLTTEVWRPDNWVLTIQDAPGDECFVVLDGEAVAVRDGVALGTLQPGTIFGEMALLDGRPRVATVWSLTTMKLLAMSRREFDALLHAGIPAVNRRIAEAVATRLREVDERVVTQATGRTPVALP